MSALCLERFMVKLLAIVVGMTDSDKALPSQLKLFLNLLYKKQAGSGEAFHGWVVGFREGDTII